MKDSKFTKSFYNKIDQEAVKWYALVVIAGREQEMKDLYLSSKELDVQDAISMESDVQAEDLSGYVFLKMKMNIKKFGIIMENECVLRFIGKPYGDYSTKTYIPDVISEADINKIKTSAFIKPQTIAEKKKSKKKLKVGDEVVIIEGDLASIRGKIIEIGVRKIKIEPESFLGKIITVTHKNIERV